MKKKIISICITLILFCSSFVPVFAVDLVADTQVPFWLLDIRNQCYLSNNVVDVTFGLATYGNDVSHYLVEIVKGGALYLTYEVPAGETVYFRWAIARNNMGNTGASTFVRMSVDGSQKVNHTYNYSNLGDYGTYGSIVIVEDYTNTSNSKQLVTYVIENDGVGNPTYEYVPILVGTEALINQGNTSFGDFDYTVDLTGVEDKLDDIIELLRSPTNNINFEIPFDLWQLYTYFINGFDYSYNVDSSKIPWLVRNSPQSASYDDSIAFRGYFQEELMYFSFISRDKKGTIPKLISSNGRVLDGWQVYMSYRNAVYGTVFTYAFDVPYNTNEYFSLYLPNESTYDTIIPLYLGDGSNVSEAVENYIGLASPRTSILESISSKLSDLINSSSSVIENATNTNNQLSNTVNQYDSIEQQQVHNFTENIANLPSFDFGSISDFSTTANFVSTQMQNIYNSSDYIKFIYTAVLTFGIALVLIGRGLHR